MATTTSRSPQQEFERSAVFMEALEVCVHTILRLRKVYPEEAFCRHRAFGVPVYMSRHPELNAYIFEVLQSARKLVEAKGVERVSVCVLDGSDRVAENYSFELDASAECDDRDEVDSVEDTAYLMRALLMRLQVMEDQLPPPPTDSSFTVLLRSRDDGPAVRDFLSNPDNGWLDASNDTSNDDGPFLWPVKHVLTPLVDFSLNVYTRQQRPTTNTTTTTSSSAPIAAPPPAD